MDFTMHPIVESGSASADILFNEPWYQHTAMTVTIVDIPRSQISDLESNCASGVVVTIVFPGVDTNVGKKPKSTALHVGDTLLPMDDTNVEPLSRKSTRDPRLQLLGTNLPWTMRSQTHGPKSGCAEPTGCTVA